MDTTKGACTGSVNVLLFINHLKALVGLGGPTRCSSSEVVVKAQVPERSRANISAGGRVRDFGAAQERLSTPLQHSRPQLWVARHHVAQGHACLCHTRTTLEPLSESRPNMPYCDCPAAARHACLYDTHLQNLSRHHRHRVLRYGFVCQDCEKTILDERPRFVICRCITLQAFLGLSPAAAPTARRWRCRGIRVGRPPRPRAWRPARCRCSRTRPRARPRPGCAASAMPAAPASALEGLHASESEYFPKT